MNRSLEELADAIGSRLLGSGKTTVGAVASINSAKPGDLVFVEDEKYLPAALASAATAVIAGEFASSVPSAKPLLIAKNPRLAFARAAALIAPPGQVPAGTHPSAVVAKSARIGARVCIEAHAVIGEHVEIGEGTRIGAGAVVGERVHVGAECNVAPNVTIYPGVRLGRRVVVHAGAVLGSDGFGFVPDPASGRHQKFPQVGSLEIGHDVEIGANCTIDRGALDATIIGRGTKLDNLVHIGHNVRLGENVVIAAQTGLSGSVTIEDGAVIGGQVGIGDHVRIEKGVILGSQSGVLPNKVVRGPGVVFWGTPARPLRHYLKELALLARLAKKSDK